MPGVVLKTEHLADVIEELRWLTSCGIKPISSPSWRPESIDNRHRAKLPENPSNIILSGQNCLSINGSAERRYAMEECRPLVFIGSSTEGLDVAKALQQNLNDICEGELWTQGFFRLGNGYLETLVNGSQTYDFAILVLTPDDMIDSRGVTQQSPRDNILFELGLFIGVLGRQRTFAVLDGTADIKLPSDMAGVSLAQYRPPTRGTLQAALGTVSTQIEAAIRDQGLRRRDGAMLARELEQARQTVHEFGARAAGAWWERIPGEGIGFFQIKLDELQNSVKLEDGLFFDAEGTFTTHWKSEVARIVKDDKQIVYLRKCWHTAHPSDGWFHGYGDIEFAGYRRSVRPGSW